MKSGLRTNTLFMLEIKAFICNPIEENTYVVSDETKEAVIVDCGAFYPEEKENLKTYIDQNGLTVKHLLLTHNHFDHVFGNEFVKTEYGLSPEGFGKEEITFGNHSFQVIHTPGHAADAVVFYCKDEEVAFTGDTIFQGCIGRTDLEGGNHSQLMKSIEKLKLLIPDHTKLLPGHGPATTIYEEKKSNPFF